MTATSNERLLSNHLESADQISSAIAGVARHLDDALAVSLNVETAKRYPSLIGVNVACDLAIVIEAAALQLNGHLAVLMDNIGGAK